MDYQFPFEKLEVWKLSKDFVKEIYRLTNEFPDSEKYGMVSQIRRAAISVPNNLAEGAGRFSGKDQARFSEIAYGSLMEVTNLLIISIELEMLSKEKVKEMMLEIHVIAKKISSLRNYQIEHLK